MATFVIPSNCVRRRFGAQTPHIARLHYALIIIGSLILIANGVAFSHWRTSEGFAGPARWPLELMLFALPDITIGFSLIHLAFFHFERPFAINAALHPVYTLIFYGCKAAGWIVQTVFMGFLTWDGGPVTARAYYQICDVISIVLCVAMIWTCLIYFFLSIGALCSNEAEALKKLRQQDAEAIARGDCCKLCGQGSPVHQQQLHPKSLLASSLREYQKETSDSQRKLPLADYTISETAVQGTYIEKDHDSTKKEVIESIMDRSDTSGTISTAFSESSDDPPKRSMWDMSIFEITEARRWRQKEKKARKEIQKGGADGLYCSGCYDRLRVMKNK